MAFGLEFPLVQTKLAEGFGAKWFAYEYYWYCSCHYFYVSLTVTGMRPFRPKWRRLREVESSFACVVMQGKPKPNVTTYSHRFGQHWLASWAAALALLGQGCRVWYPIRFPAAFVSQPELGDRWTYRPRKPRQQRRSPLSPSLNIYIFIYLYIYIFIYLYIYICVCMCVCVCVCVRARACVCLCAYTWYSDVFSCMCMYIICITYIYSTLT